MHACIYQVTGKIKIHLATNKWKLKNCPEQVHLSLNHMILIHKSRAKKVLKQSILGFLLRKTALNDGDSLDLFISLKPSGNRYLFECMAK